MILFNDTSKPYVRWWWLTGPYRHDDIAGQLDWLKTNGFGGVELAWIYPSWLRVLHTDNPEWLGSEWSDLITFTKQYADRIGLGCDFTFGGGWPFGGRCVDSEHAARTFRGLSSERLRNSWENETTGGLFVLDHLSRAALREYAKAMAPAFRPALSGSASALFCDSLEIDRRELWSDRMWRRFKERFGYSIRPFRSDLEAHPEVRYDYRKLVAEVIRREFYGEFAAICQGPGAYSRVQCHGAPTDLLSAYSSVDVPESESLLFPPRFSRIPASAATLSGKPVVSAETFTCIYGFPGWQGMFRRCHLTQENVADLKLLADALMANGVNQIVWHGMPYNPPGGYNEFYAGVHVGARGELAPHLKDFNAYMEKACAVMKRGRTSTNLAMYLPNEDQWMKGRLPDDLLVPGAAYHWEMRYVVPPHETEPYQPIWISGPFLKQAEFTDGRLECGDAVFSALYVDCAWIDLEAIVEIRRLAEAGLPIVLRQRPAQPGRNKDELFYGHLKALDSLSNVVPHLSDLSLSPLVAGPELPWYWARQDSRELFIFFANPATKEIRFPMRLGQALTLHTFEAQVVVHYSGHRIPCGLRFQPWQSLLLRFDQNGSFEQIDIAYTPS